MNIARHRPRLSCSVLACVLAGCLVHAAPRSESLGPVLLRMTGAEMAWQMRYAGPDGQLDTPDDVTGRKQIHLAAGRPARILLTSRDLLYTLSIPACRVHEIAVPELEFAIDLPTLPPGEFPFAGDQMCGFQHDILFGRVIVHPAAEFETWLEQHAGH